MADNFADPHRRDLLKVLAAMPVLALLRPGTVWAHGDSVRILTDRRYRYLDSNAIPNHPTSSPASVRETGARRPNKACHVAHGAAPERSGGLSRSCSADSGRAVPTASARVQASSVGDCGEFVSQPSNPALNHTTGCR